MFLLNVPYSWTSLEHQSLDGAVFRPSVLNYVALTEKRDIDKYEDFGARIRERDGYLLLDPQLYLADYDFNLSDDEQKKLVGRLAGYPWFLADVEEYDSDTHSNVTAWKNSNQKKAEDLWTRRRRSSHDDDSQRVNWRDAVQSAVQVQIDFGVTHVVLPSRLLRDMRYGVEKFVSDLEIAIEIAQEIAPGADLLASVPVDAENASFWASHDFEEVEALCDVIASESRLAGAYITYSGQVGEEARLASRSAAMGILMMCNFLGNKQSLNVVTNFLGEFGVATLAFGASAFAGGYSRKQRCCYVGDFQKAFGGAYPKLLSLSVCLDLRTSRDVVGLERDHLLYLLEADRTDECSGLLDAVTELRDETKVDNQVPRWSNSRSNTKAAKSHAISNLCQWSRRMLRPADASRWLINADMYSDGVVEALAESPPDVRHVRVWRNAVVELLDKWDVG